MHMATRITAAVAPCLCVGNREAQHSVEQLQAATKHTPTTDGSAANHAHSKRSSSLPQDEAGDTSHSDESDSDSDDAEAERGGRPRSKHSIGATLSSKKMVIYECFGRCVPA